MLSRRSLAVAGTATRLLLSDPAPFMVTIVTPLFLTAFLMPVSRAQLRSSGYLHATGAEQLIPGMAVMFALFGTSLIGNLFFREHAWGTWERLRASPASALDVVVGKVAPTYVVQLLQMAALFGIGSLVFGYRMSGSVPALALILVVFGAMLMAYGVMLVAVFSTMDQNIVVSSLGGMLMAGIGGALAPASIMPHWVQTIAHFTPGYWALEALRRVTLTHAGVEDVVRPLLIIIAFALGFSVIAAIRFRPSDRKVGTT